MTAGISPHSFFSFFFFLFPTSRLSVLLALNPTQKRRRPPPPPAPFFFGLSAKGGAGGAEKEKLNGAIRKARAVLLRAVASGSARGRGWISAGLMGSMRPKGREGGGEAAAAQSGLGLAAPGAGGSSQTFFCGLPAFGGFEREALGAIGDLGFGFGGLAPP